MQGMACKFASLPSEKSLNLACYTREKKDVGTERNLHSHGPMRVRQVGRVLLLHHPPIPSSFIRSQICPTRQMFSSRLVNSFLRTSLFPRSLFLPLRDASLTAVHPFVEWGRCVDTASAVLISLSRLPSLPSRLVSESTLVKKMTKSEGCIL